jgi:hypothetical protein
MSGPSTWIAGRKTLVAASNLLTGINGFEPIVECLDLTIYLCFNDAAKVDCPIDSKFFR